MTGIDMVADALAVARRHAAENRVRVDYREGTAEAWARQHPGRYDVVTCMELVEHVPDPASLVAACARLVVCARRHRSGSVGHRCGLLADPPWTLDGVAQRCPPQTQGLAQGIAR